MGTCCSQACCPTQSMRSGWGGGVPAQYASGYKYNDSDPNVPCCTCAFTDAFCKGIDSSYPHAGSDCGPCQCDHKKVQIQRAAYDSCLKPVPPVGWRCPPDKPVWKNATEGCECVCDKSPGDCLPHQTFRADFCRCICEKDLIVCDKGDPCSSKPFLENPTPNYHPEDCSCKCDLDVANGGPGCTGNLRKPEFNAAKCECKCRYDTGEDTCPSRYPYVMKTACDCECPDSVSESCTADQEFDVDTCSCKPCPNTCRGEQTRKPGLCDCECLKSPGDCPKDAPVLDDDCTCYCPIAIQMGCTGRHKRFVREQCACVYDATVLSILLEP